MPIQLPNFLAAQLPRGPKYNPDYSGIANFIPQALQAYRAPFAMQEERSKNLGEIEKRHMENALLKEFGPREKEAEIASKMAYAQYMLQGGQAGIGGLTPGMRAINAMPAAAKETYLAKIRGKTGLSDPEIIKNVSLGWTDEDFDNFGREKGIDVENAGPKWSIQTPNITAQQKRVIVSAGHKVINDFTSPAKEPYIRTIKGHSPQLIWDQLKGENPDKVAKFLAARAMEEEEALQNVVKSGGNVNMHAVRNMVDKTMGNAKIIPALVSPEVYNLTHKYIMDTMQKAVDAEQNAISELATTSFKSNESLKDAAETPLSKTTSMGMKPPMQTIPGEIMGKNGKMMKVNIPLDRLDAFKSAGGVLYGD